MTDMVAATLPGCDSTGAEYSADTGILQCVCGCGRPRPGSRRRGRPGSAYASDACRARVRNRRIAQLVALGAKFAAQPALPGESRVERAFTAWIGTAEGWYVEREVVRLAREDKAAGDGRGELNLYLALVRRSARGLRRDPAGFRCSNNHRSLLARKIMQDCADLRDFFELRVLRGRT